MLAVNSVFRRAVALIPKAMRRRSVLSKLGDLPFGIVSNNCWEAHIYKEAGLTYATPFVGLALSAELYLHLLSNWDIVQGPLLFKDGSSEEWIEEMRKARGTFRPVGELAGHVEIQFMHYSNRDEARAK